MFDFFVEYLYGAEENLRGIAMQGLKDLDTKEARRVLWEAQAHVFPDEVEYISFHKRLSGVVGPSR